MVYYVRMLVVFLSAYVLSQSGLSGYSCELSRLLSASIMTVKDPSKVNPLSKLYFARKRGMAEFSGLPQRVQTVLICNNYTKERLEQEIRLCEFEPKLPNLGSHGFEEILKWIEYK